MTDYSPFREQLDSKSAERLETDEVVIRSTVKLREEDDNKSRIEMVRRELAVQRDMKS